MTSKVKRYPRWKSLNSEMTEIPEIYQTSVHVLLPGIEVETIQPILYRPYMIIYRPFFQLKLVWTLYHTNIFDQTMKMVMFR